MSKYVCIHGHFYQPPRENAALEAVEVQESAHPYHDWNERITAECYAPNAAARILDEAERVAKLVSNYSRMSFDFGPTLLTWLAREARPTYEAILEADRTSRARFSGHGSALAHGYNHSILPLSNERDRRTQVVWGIRDFELRFERPPEGFWLPETAVDLATLGVLAEHGIRFTVLSPYQARRVRRGGHGEWTEVDGGRVDPTQAYRVALPSGRSIAVFFYDGPVARGVAFEHLLSNGEHFARRILGTASEHRAGAQLLHIATDGESYGHHHRRGEMALARALDFFERTGAARLTNYGEFLEMHPPTHEVEVIEGSSWSCAHGVERWRSDCGCNGGSHPGWNQGWRRPLRAALDGLRDELAWRFETHGRELFRDPWAARDEYVRVIYDRSRATTDAFLTAQGRRPLDARERVAALELLEMQRHTLLMYTSCAWFFDDVSGLETVQVLQYAGRALQLAPRPNGPDGLEASFLAALALARSNVREHRDGREVYERLVRPTLADLSKVAAHHAVSTLFEDYSEATKVFCYEVRRLAHRVSRAGRARLVVGRAAVTSELTHASAVFSYAVIHLGDHTLVGGVRNFRGIAEFDLLVEEVLSSFTRADFREVLHLLDSHFEASTYSLRSLFRDQQRRVIERVFEVTRAEAEAAYERLHQAHAPLLRFLGHLGVAPPSFLPIATAFSLGAQLRQAFEAAELDGARVEALVSEVREGRVPIDEAAVVSAAERAVLARAERAVKTGAPEHVESWRHAVQLVRALPFDVDLCRSQELFFRLAPTPRAGRGQGEEPGAVGPLRALADLLSIRID